MRVHNCLNNLGVGDRNGHLVVTRMAGQSESDIVTAKLVLLAADP